MKRDDDDSDEFDLPDGVYHDDDDPGTVPCPYCRAEIFEGADRCPQCENYISAEDAPAAPRSPFLAIMMVLALGIAAWWVLRG